MRADVLSQRSASPPTSGDVSSDSLVKQPASFPSPLWGGWTRAVASGRVGNGGAQQCPTRLAASRLGTLPTRGRDKKPTLRHPVAAMPGRTFVSFSPSLDRREGAERRSAHPG